MYRLKKALENGSQLQQAMKDKESGGGSSLKLSTIEPEVLEIAKNPYILLPCLYSHDDLLSTISRYKTFHYCSNIELKLNCVFNDTQECFVYCFVGYIQIFF